MHRRFLVIGLARAGTAMAIALAKSGAKVHVVDQKAPDQLSMLKEMDSLEALGIEVRTAWSGEVDWSEIDVIAASPGVPPRHPTLREAQAKGIPIWSEIEVAHRISKAPIVAITGTNGKSTVTALTYFILKNCGRNAVLCGNIAGSGYQEIPITTAALKSTPDEILVAEVSSYQLEFIDEFRPRACTITNIGEDHIDRHGSIDIYKATKKRIYENQTPEDFSVVNKLRPETIASEMRARILFYNGADADIEVTETHVGGIHVDDLWLPGRHTLDNAAAAWLLARSMGAQDEEIAGAVREFKGIRNRMELLAVHNGIRFVNNTMCTNPEALRASIESCRGMIVLIAGGALEARNLSPLDRIDLDRVRATFLIGKDAQALAPHFPEGSRILEDIPQAFAAAMEVAQPGDSVLLAPGCKSFDQFEDFIARGETFRTLVHKYIGA
ncbi:MAG: UDP-N-acetylmuramoyl-L-alanine--D-glutamate ligase [Armatimonadota bacterium]|nr:UDP-N-acetylmuramoyl-L-alanine--D-glutamate ligase [Armatimonadota bacterium]